MASFETSAQLLVAEPQEALAVTEALDADLLQGGGRQVLASARRRRCPPRGAHFRTSQTLPQLAIRQPGTRPTSGGFRRPGDKHQRDEEE